MTNYRQQIERLKRHYKSSLNHYDSISFLDLVHTLRLWTEIKDNLNASYPDVNISNGVITQSIKRIFRRSEYVYAFLPDGITTNAVATGENNGRNLFYGPYSEAFTQGGLAKENIDGSLSISQFALIHKALSDKEIKILNIESHNVPLEKISYVRYMNSPIIRFRFTSYTPTHISVEELIKRVANEYDASHADVEETGFELQNSYSGPVKKIMQYGCMNLPLPYFALLHVAKTIIDNYDARI